MKQLCLGIVLGSLLTAGLVSAGSFYNKDGSLDTPRGSQKSMDYFRSRGAQLDIAAMRRHAEQDRAAGRVPCAK